MIDSAVARVTKPVKDLRTNIHAKAKNGFSGLMQVCFWFGIFLVCLWMSFILYALIYNVFIPYTYQTQKLTLVKKKDGFEARVFNPKGDFPVCKHDSLFMNTDNFEKDPVSRTCLNPMQTNNVNIPFDLEMYDMHLKMVVPLLPQNFELGDFPVRTEFINKHFNVFYADSVGYFDQMKFRVYSIERIYNTFKSGLGMDENHALIDVQLTANFDNRLFGLNVMNIYVMESRLVVKNAYLELYTKTGGARYYMAHWFWTAAIFTVTASAIICFMSAFIGTYGVKFINAEYLSQKKE